MLEQQIKRWLAHIPKERSTCNALDLPMVLSTDIGRVRKENQDRVAAMRVHTGPPANKSFVCIALCDGMGGMSDGAASATLALSAFFTELIRSRRLQPMEKLKAAVDHANHQVFAAYNGKGGTTLTSVLLEEGQAYSANVGDSRIYVEKELRDDHTLERVTIDDNLSEAFGGHGNELVQFIGVGDGLSPHINELPIEAKSFMTTSDGVHFVDEDTFSKVFINAPDLQQASQRLMDLSQWFGGPDNATIAAFNLQKFNQEPQPQEGGHVELWNPFGPLQLFWATKEDQSKTPILAIQDDPSPEKSVNEHNKDEEKEKPKKSIRKKPRKRKKKTTDDDPELFQIDVKFGEDGEA